MDKSSKETYSLAKQVESWNAWNKQVRGAWTDDQHLNRTSRRQAEFIEQSIARLGLASPNILEVGCGSGWMCARLTRFGNVTGTDLADEVLREAQARWPAVKFVSGDFMTLDLPLASFDVVATLEVLSHLQDQPAFIKRIAALLKPGGVLLLATQNRPVLERWSAIGGPVPGQHRRWVDARELRALLTPHFMSVKIESVVPVGDQGLLRIINSTKLNRLLSMVIPQPRIDRIKEKMMLGHTLLATATK